MPEPRRFVYLFRRAIIFVYVRTALVCTQLRMSVAPCNRLIILFSAITFCGPLRQF